MYNGEEFLNKLYQDLYKSDDVQKEIKRYELKGNERKELGKKNEKLEDISIYLKRLEEGYRSIDSDRKKEILKQLFYNKYVIKKEDIPSYMNKEAIIQNQKDSLDKWIDYLTDPNARYEMWAKYWTFQGMLKMGSYDEARGEFNKRSKNTINPFIDCNPEIVSNCISVITKYVHGEKIDDKRLNELVNSGNFSKIYTLFYQKYKAKIKEKSDYKDGKWVKYNYKNEEDAKKLAKSLENKNTGWCTANEEMAIRQICGCNLYPGGDFYVYYTKDKDNNYTIPRIAIRMDGINKIGEIRGINDGQNLEEGLEDILEEKLESFKFLDQEDKYISIDKINDSKLVTNIKKKTEKREVLNKKETNFLWSGEPINLFGFSEEKSISDVRKKRIKNHLLEKDFNLLDENNQLSILSTNSDLLYILDYKKVPNYDKLIKNILEDEQYLIGEIDPDSIKDYYDLLKSLKIDFKDLINNLDEGSTYYNKIVDRLLIYDPNMIKKLNPENKNYQEISFKVLCQNPELLDDINLDYISNYNKFFLDIAKKNPNILKYLNPLDVSNYEEIAKVCVKQNNQLIAYVDPYASNFDELFYIIQNTKIKYPADDIEDDYNGYFYHR